MKEVCWPCMPRAAIAGGLAGLLAFFAKAKPIWIVAITLIVTLLLMPLKEKEG